MRVRNVEYFIQKLNSNNLKNAGARNSSEVINAEIAEYFAQKKETKKVA